MSKDWVERLGPFLYTPEFDWLVKSMNYYEIYPDITKVFRIFRLLPPDKIKVIIVGKDPYRNKGEATGIAMGVENLPYTPPTLDIMFDEIERDFRCRPQDRSLMSWVNQGVFLMNAALTVEPHKSGSHGAMWAPFMKNFFTSMSDYSLPYVFLGNEAKTYSRYVDAFNNFIIASPHPAVDAYTKTKIFYGGGLFSKINSYLKEPIKWCDV